MLRTKPYPYQRKGIMWIDRDFQGRALLADEMGLGKSIQAIGYWERAAGRYPGRPAVVICPAGLRYNWLREFRTHAGVTPAILEKRQATPVATAKVYIVGYETLGKVSDKKSWAYFLKRLKPWLIIVDECHKMKNLQARQTKNILKFGKGVPAKVALSGTPIINRPAELWPVLHFLRPNLYPSFMSFAVKHCSPERKPWGWEFKGAERLDELHLDLLSNVMIRRLKADVLHELPDKIRHVTVVPIAKRKEYDTAYVDFLAWARKNYKNKITTISRNQALVKSGYLLRLVGKLKLASVINWLNTWLDENPGQKIIVFGKHTDLITELHNQFPKSVVITGSVLMKKRDLVQHRFKTDPQCRILFGNIEAAGVGWNGICASTVAFFEYDWRPGIHKQCEDRAHRIGQIKDVSCYYLTAHNTIEEKMCSLIQAKQAISDAVLDGRDVKDQLSIFDQLMESLL